MTLGIPTFNQVQLTQQFLWSLHNSVADYSDINVVVIDNGSTTPISSRELEDYYPNVKVLRNETNLGYFYPLKQLVDSQTDDYVGICHNDIAFHEDKWDDRIRNYFYENPMLGLVGLCGSDKLDENGEMVQIMGNFFDPEGETGQSNFSKPVKGLIPAVCIDSLFMMFRHSVARKLTGWNDITPYHWFDRFWSMQTLESGYKVGIVGTKVSHMGGGTASSPEFKRFIREKEGLHGSDVLYSRTKKKFLDKYGAALPLSVDSDWHYSCSPKGGEY